MTSAEQSDCPPEAEAVASAGRITVLLARFQAGDATAADELLNQIYPELKRIARLQLRADRQRAEIAPTELVHEAYLRLVRQTDRQWEHRLAFYAAAAVTMRRILIDAARARLAKKRDIEGALLISDETVPSSGGDALDLLSLHDALERLAQLSPRQARVVELRFFAGLSVPEVAAVLGITSRSVDRDWATARAWIKGHLGRA